MLNDKLETSSSAGQSSSARRIEKESPWAHRKKLSLTTVSAMLQGGWEDDESIDEAACREAFEEAGVKGVISVGALTYS